MKDKEEYIFKINAYTPNTIPMARLAEYLAEFAKMLGEEKRVHFLRLRKGSTIAVHTIDRESVPKVEARVNAIKTGEAPVDAMRAYRKLNKMLQEDNGTGVYAKEKGAEIIAFPGIQSKKPEYTSIKQAGEIDGRVMRIGGMTDPVPILLEVDGIQLSGCSATKSIAKPLANRLFEPVRLYGDGYWSRDEEGEWSLEKFSVNHFEPLQDETLSSVVMGLRGIRGDNWGYDAIKELLNQRYGDGEPC